MKYNNKKRFLFFLLWICVMACITGIPWGFFPLQKIYSYIGFNGTPSYMTRFLFTQQSLFFSFFFLYFLLLKKDIEKYKEILSIGTCLIGFMGCFMYVLKCRTGLIYWCSIYEPFIWLFIGSSMFLLNLSIKTKRVNKRLLFPITVLFRILSFLLVLNLCNIFYPKEIWDLLFRMPYDSASSLDKYIFGLVSGFCAFSSVIIYYLSNRISNFAHMAKLVAIFFFMFFAYSLISFNPNKLYTPVGITYIAINILITFSSSYSLFKLKKNEK